MRAEWVQNRPGGIWHFPRADSCGADGWLADGWLADRWLADDRQ